MATRVIADVVLVGGVPKDDVAVAAYAASRFSAEPGLNDPAPDADPPDASGTTGPQHGGKGAWRLTVPTEDAYYVRALLGDVSAWGFFAEDAGGTPGVDPTADEQITGSWGFSKPLGLGVGPGDPTGGFTEDFQSYAVNDPLNGDWSVGDEEDPGIGAPVIVDVTGQNWLISDTYSVSLVPGSGATKVLRLGNDGSPGSTAHAGAWIRRDFDVPAEGGFLRVKFFAGVRHPELKHSDVALYVLAPGDDGDGTATYPSPPDGGTIFDFGFNLQVSKTDPLLNRWLTAELDLSRWAGQTVRFFAAVDEWHADTDWAALYIQEIALLSSAENAGKLHLLRGGMPASDLGADGDVAMVFGRVTDGAEWALDANLSLGGLSLWERHQGAWREQPLLDSSARTLINGTWIFNGGPLLRGLPSHAGGGLDSTQRLLYATFDFDRSMGTMDPVAAPASPTDDTTGTKAAIDALIAVLQATGILQ